MGSGEQDKENHLKRKTILKQNQKLVDTITKNEHLTLKWCTMKMRQSVLHVQIAHHSHHWFFIFFIIVHDGEYVHMTGHVQFVYERILS